MKKYLIPILFVAGILSVTLMIFAFDRPLNRTNSVLDPQNENYTRGGRMGFGESMMGGNFYQDRAILTDLSGSGYDAAKLKSALDVVLADEYKNLAEYKAIVVKFGEVSPFVQLIYAETRHIESLVRIYDAFDFAVLADNGSASAVVPSSLEAAYQVGIEAETANIALYETYLKTKLPESVDRIFSNLQNASDRHLDIFTDYANGEVDAGTCPMLGGNTQRRGRNQSN